MAVANTLSAKQKSVIVEGLLNGDVLGINGFEECAELLIPLNLDGILPDNYDCEAFSLIRAGKSNGFIYYEMPFHKKNWRDWIKEV